MSERSLMKTQRRLREFRDRRDWRQFHTLSNLASAINVEAGELLDLFRWSPPVEESAILESKRSDVENELADVVIQCLNFADVAEVDLLEAIDRKIELNERKYPVEAARGRADKHADL